MVQHKAELLCVRIRRRELCSSPTTSLQLTRLWRMLYETHSWSRVSETASRFSIFFIWFRPNDKIFRFSMPDKLLIFSMLLVDRARCLQGGSQTRGSSAYLQMQRTGRAPA